MQDISDFKCPYISKEQIWQEAESFRDEFWPANILPIDIEMIVEKGLKLNIEPEHDLLSELDIDAYLRVDLTGIIVDYNCYMNEKFMNRLRFSFAHELGHFFYTRTFMHLFLSQVLWHGKISWKIFLAGNMDFSNIRRTNLQVEF